MVKSKSSLRKLTNTELSDLINRADEHMIDQMMKTQQNVDAGRIAAEQGDYKIQDLVDDARATKREIESEQFRREKNKALRNKIFSIIAILFAAGMLYFVLLK